MAHLIDKDALVAEIDRISNNAEEVNNTSYLLLCNHLKSFLNALEMKEVDLEKEIDRYYGMYRKNGITYDVSDNETCFDWKNDELAEHEMHLAKHFFELGLKTQNGE